MDDNNDKTSASFYRSLRCYTPEMQETEETLRDTIRYPLELMALSILRDKKTYDFEVAITQYQQAMIRYRVRVPGRGIRYAWKYIQNFRDNDALEFQFKKLMAKTAPEKPEKTRVWYREEYFAGRLRRQIDDKGRDSVIRGGVNLIAFNMCNWSIYAYGESESYSAYDVQPVTLNLYDDEVVDDLDDCEDEDY